MKSTPFTDFRQEGSRRVYALVPLLVLLALVIYMYLAVDGDGLLVPDTLGGLRLHDVLKGDAARELIDHLHAKGVTPEKNEIGFYRGPGGNATLYVSVYASEQSAAATEQRMAEKIRAGNRIFGDYREILYNRLTVKRCSGMGQEHYFFSTGNHLYWLAVDEPLAEQTLAETLTRVRR